jgi:hypothetical protein
MRFAWPRFQFVNIVAVLQHNFALAAPDERDKGRWQSRDIHGFGMVSENGCIDGPRWACRRVSSEQGPGH